jgi:hypothetical protein
MKRTLHLRTEVLTELTTDELRGVAGGVDTTFDCSRYCNSVRQCPTLLPLTSCPKE